MAFEAIRQQLADTEANIRSYVEHSAEYYQLKSFKVLMRGITSFSRALLVGAIAFMALFFLSLAASFGIGQLLNNTFYGFLCVGLFYVLVGMLAFLLRHQMDGPLLKKFSTFYFEEL